MADNQSSIYIKQKVTQSRVTFTQLSLYLIMLFPITTLMQGYIDFINRLLFGLTFIVLLIAILYKATRQTLYMGVVVASMCIIALLQTDFPLYNRNEPFYFLFWVMLVFFLNNKKEIVDDLLINNEKYIKGIIIIWSALIAFAMIMPSSYPYSYLYFKPYGLNGFRSAPTALFILTLILIATVYYKNKRYAFYSFFPMFVLFMGSSRTYFGVGILLFAILWYVICDKTDKFFITAIPVAIVVVIVFQFSGISHKVEETTWSEGMYFDYWATLTNGRSIFWEYDLKGFMDYPFLKKLFGGGYNVVYRINAAKVNTAIWAHNDFIQLLLCYGITGIGVYLYSYYYLCKNLLYKNTRKIPFIVFFLFLFVWLANASFNMFYTYFCSCLSYPLIAFALNRYFVQKGDGQFFEKTKDKKASRPKSKYIK